MNIINFELSLQSVSLHHERRIKDKQFFKHVGIIKKKKASDK